MGTKNLSAAAAIILTAALTAPVNAQDRPHPSLNSSINVASAVTNIGAGSTGGATVFAQELFGENSESIKLSITNKSIILRYPDNPSVETVDDEQTAVLTFKFNGARLGESISAGTLVFRTVGGNADTNVSFTAGRDGGGGQRGDDFVSYTLTANASVPLRNKEFVFTVPDIQMVTVAGGEDLEDRIVTVAVTLDPPAASRFGTVGSPFPKFPFANPIGAAEMEGLEPRVIAAINPAYTLVVEPSATATTPNMAEINLENPTMFTATSTPIQVSGFGSSAVTGIKISTVTTTAVAGVKTADGSTDFTGGTTDMLRAAVTGNFAAADRLFLSTTTTGNVTYSATGDTLLTVSADGTSAEGSRPLSGTGAVSSGTPYALYYVPGGGQIQRGTIGTRYTLDFAAPTARDSAMGGQGLTLEFSGISFTNYAYAIPGPNASDAGNLRIRCEGASECVVFFRCTDTAGMNVGGFERTNIGAGTVEHMSSMEIATMLGVDDWTGRLSCSLHSSSRVSVQLLVRSGGTLTNNTFIGGLDASQ